MRDQFSHIGKTIAVDNFLPTLTRGIKNYPVFIESPVVKYWHEPSSNSRVSGSEYVKVSDGRIFSRPDHYATTSPYGWTCETNVKEPI